MIRTFARSRPSDAAAVDDDGDDLFSYFVTHCCHRLFVLFVSCVIASPPFFLCTLTLYLSCFTFCHVVFHLCALALSYQSECCLFCPLYRHHSYSLRCSIMYQRHIDWKRLSQTLECSVKEASAKKREGDTDSSMGTNFNRLQFKCYHCAYVTARVCVWFSLSFSSFSLRMLIHACELPLVAFTFFFVCCGGDTISHSYTHSNVEYQFTWRSYTQILQHHHRQRAAAWRQCLFACVSLAIYLSWDGCRWMDNGYHRSVFNFKWNAQVSTIPRINLFGQDLTIWFAGML